MTYLFWDTPCDFLKGQKITRFAIGLVIVILVTLTIVVGCSSAPTADEVPPAVEGVAFNEIKVTVFQLPNCECCKRHIAYLKEQGFQVETIYTTEEMYTEDVSFLLTKEYQIPRYMESCHTAVIEDYFVEGHMPVEAIIKLLEEKPDIDGISLPGMLLGSPGMPGQQAGAFQIYALSDGTASEFMIINE